MVEMDEEMSFETLLKLRDEVGLKTFEAYERNKYAAETQNSSKKSKIIKKQAAAAQKDEDDDEPPMEISSKHPFRKNKPSHKWRMEKRTIDPRFSDRAGKFNEEICKKNYQFAFNLREQELQSLKETQAEDDEEEYKRNFLIQRMENQKQERDRKKNASVTKNFDTLANGEKFYKKRSVRSTEALVNKFVELKKSGQLEKHIDRRRKKLAGMERKKMNIAK